MELNEAQLYNLSGGYGYSQIRDIIKFMIRQQAIHLKTEHGYGKRKIAKRLGLKMKQVEEILTSDEDTDNLFED